MSRDLKIALAGTILAIVVTTTMDATGYSMFSSLPLLPLSLLFWWLAGLSRNDAGLTWGTLRGYGWALAYPVIVLGLVALIAWLAGATEVTETDWNKTLLRVGLASSVGTVMVLLTEEGFFRGWLWGALERHGWSDRQVLVWTSLAFAAWHVSVVSFDTGFGVPANEIPVYLVNVALLGAIWGLLRMLSGSALVPAVSHAVWNGLDYPLFGFGEKAGALGIQDTHLFGPEVGLLGIALNVLFFAILWRYCADRVSRH